MSYINKPYKVYTALLTQTGTAAPVATILENTLSNIIVWSYNSAGRYIGTLVGEFILNKTFTIIESGSSTADVANHIEANGTDELLVYSREANVGTNGILFQTSIEIKIYQ